MLMMIDNYDSFTYNLVQYFGELGADVTVERNDEVSVQQVIDSKPYCLVISPGPCTPKDAGISGKVYVNFIVDKDGSITNVNVKRGIGGGCDKEAMRVIKKMPKWKPGKQRGKPVKVSFNMPINFILR